MDTAHSFVTKEKPHPALSTKAWFWISGMDLLILALFCAVTIWQYIQIHHNKSVVTISNKMILLGDQSVNCPNLSWTKIQNCHIQDVLFEEDTLHLYHFEFENIFVAIQYANQIKQSNLPSFRFGLETWQIDSAQRWMWSAELQNRLINQLDPTGHIAQKSLKPFPLKGLNIDREWAEIQLHLGFRTAKPWLCREYILNGNQEQACIAHFDNNEQCLSWRKELGSPNWYSSDSTSGMWTAKDGQEVAWVSCSRGQGLSIQAQGATRNLMLYGAEMVERLRHFPDWDRQ